MKKIFVGEKTQKRVGHEGKFLFGSRHHSGPSLFKKKKNTEKRTLSFFIGDLCHQRHIGSSTRREKFDDIGLL